MRNSDQGDGAILITAVIIGLVLLGGAGVILVRLRHQQAILAMERARADAVRAEAIAQQQRAEALAAEALAAEFAVPASEVRNLGSSFQVEIRELLDAQTQAWNDADVEQFMRFYQRSDELVVCFDRRLTRTWEGARKEFEECAGSDLALSNVEITQLGSDAAMVVGNWLSDSEGQQESGIVTMLLRRLEGQWAIVHEHRSQTTPTEQ